MKNRSNTSVTAATKQNSGPGQGKYKASVGNPIELGLSSQMKVEGGSAMKVRGETNEMTQRPKGEVKTVSSDRGSFKDLC